MAVLDTTAAALAEAMETFSQAGADYFATSGCSYPASLLEGALAFRPFGGLE
jgi:hypothetical protein